MRCTILSILVGCALVSGARASQFVWTTNGLPDGQPGTTITVGSAELGDTSRVVFLVVPGSDIGSVTLPVFVPAEIILGVPMMVAGHLEEVATLVIAAGLDTPAQIHVRDPEHNNCWVPVDPVTWLQIVNAFSQSVVISWSVVGIDEYSEVHTMFPEEFADALESALLDQKYDTTRYH